MALVKALDRGPDVGDEGRELHRAGIAVIGDDHAGLRAVGFELFVVDQADQEHVDGVCLHRDARFNLLRGGGVRVQRRGAPASRWVPGSRQGPRWPLP